MAIITDTFEIKPEYGHEPGLVVVIAAPPEASLRPFIGQRVKIILPTHQELDLPTEEMKDHGPVFSIFFGGLCKKDIPIGREISW